RDFGEKTEGQSGFARTSATTTAAQGGSARTGDAKVTLRQLRSEPFRRHTGGMKFNVAMRPSSRLTGKGPRFSGILAIAIILFSSRILAQQSASSRKEVPQTAKIQSHFPDVEQLLRQGLLEQAKQKTQHALEPKPPSVPAHNFV